MRVKMSQQPPPAPTASTVGPCPTVIQIVGRPGTGSLKYCKTLSICGFKFLPLDENDILAHSNFGGHDMPLLKGVKKF